MYEFWKLVFNVILFIYFSIFLLPYIILFSIYTFFLKNDYLLLGDSDFETLKYIFFWKTKLYVFLSIGKYLLQASMKISIFIK